MSGAGAIIAHCANAQQIVQALEVASAARTAETRLNRSIVNWPLTLMSMAQRHIGGAAVCVTAEP